MFPYSFWIVPYIKTGVVILATLIFMLEICGRVMGNFHVLIVLIFTSLVLLQVISIFKVPLLGCIGMLAQFIICFHAGGTSRELLLYLNF